ncbi:MAG TPA: EAL domain-containing protein [Hydrogenothermaceae bacterium]|nr:EAL domain-containing protein [Hydrogenothermaceae bacterium]
MIDFFKILIKFKLRHILYFTLVVSAIFSIFLFTISFSNFHLKQLKKSTVEKLKIHLSLSSKLIEKNINQGDLSEVEAVITYLSTMQNIEKVFLTNEEGKIVFSSSKKYIGKDIKEVLKNFPLKRVLKENLSYLFSKNNEYIYAIDKISLKDLSNIKPVKYGNLIVVYNFKKELLSAKWALLKSILIFMLSIVSAGFIIDIIFKKYISRRIEIITDTLEKVSKGNLEVKISIFGNDEIKSIAEKINEMIDKLRGYLYYDHLTGVFNRYFFKNKVNEKISKNEKFAIVMFDTDNFKDINDLFGHQIGDKLLKQYALRLEKEIGKDGFVGRFGGDEFLLCINGDCYKNDIELKTKVEKFLKVLDNPFFVDNYKINITSTAGIAKFPEHATNYTDLLKLADIALYYGKEIGKNIVVIANEKIVKQNIRKAEITSHIRDAIKNNEFFLVYQPIVSAKDFKITGVEALLRWNSPILGSISPVEFVPVLEETGLIKEVGKWFFKEVLRQSFIWENQGIKDIKINVNVDIQQLLETGFYKFLKDEILNKNFEKLKLGIEITESEAMQYPELIIKKIKQLRLAGIVISIDDFGTGNSSLSYLKTMNVDYIKIDRSFINGIPDDEHSAILVKTIINLSKLFRYKTVAEGVETKEQVEYLRQLGLMNYKGTIFLNLSLLKI